MLDLTVGYVSERQQFGVPIGSFQAVKHHLADGLKGVGVCPSGGPRPRTRWRRPTPTTDRDVSMAKAMASDAASLIKARLALQCHGAIGYTVEYDLHIWLKRTWALARGVG